MIIPNFQTWVEQGNKFRRPRIDAGNVRAFVEIAATTRPSQIGGIVVATVLSRNNMLDMKRPFVGRRRQATILTAIASPLPHKFPSGGVHMLGSFFGKRAACLRLQKSYQIPSIDILAILVAFLVRKSSLVRLLPKFFNPSNRGSIGLQFNERARHLRSQRGSHRFKITIKKVNGSHDASIVAQWGVWEIDISGLDSQKIQPRDWQACKRYLVCYFGTIMEAVQIHLDANDDRVDYSENGELLFSMRWDDLQRVSAWRNPHPDSNDYYLSVEIVPDRSTNVFANHVYDGTFMGSEIEWNLWIAALTKHIPEFTIDKVQSVLDLSVDAANAVHILVREFQYSHGKCSQASTADAPLHDWLDRQHEKNLVAFRQSELASPTQKLFAYVYNLLAEVQNGGFEQYFGNSTGDEWLDVRKALRSIQAMPALAHLEAACEVFPNGTPGKTQDTRIRQLEIIKCATLIKQDDGFIEVVESTIAKLKSHLDRANRRASERE